MPRRGRSRSRSERPGASGFLVVDKPAGRTSHDIVDDARRWLGTRRVGHLGTLDPQATGVLPLAIRQATKLIPFIESRRKVYDGTIVLGIETDTLDAEGEIVARHDGPLPDRAEVEAALARFKGDIQQVPPMYSAVKKDGVPLHRLARQGIDVEREPKWITIDALELTRFELPQLDLRVHCSAGTYVRVLASDLGRALGCGAHLAALRRTASGPFRIDQARTVADCAAAAEADTLEAALIPASAALGFPVLEVAGEQERRLRHGGDLASGELHREPPGTRVSIVDGAGQVLAVAELGPDRRLWPLRVLIGEPG
ncbi:MAG: tRNA pseudouridine(55) synthase TruB [Deltaproteobacteria bacterium]|nr:tRNA pseudouridine(55) synthase TruB [Deltaproteobacteria bacterium]